MTKRETGKAAQSVEPPTLQPTTFLKQTFPPEKETGVGGAPLHWREKTEQLQVGGVAVGVKVAVEVRVEVTVKVLVGVPLGVKLGVSVRVKVAVGVAAMGTVMGPHWPVALAAQRAPLLLAQLMVTVLPKIAGPQRVRGKLDSADWGMASRTLGLMV